MDSSPDTSSSPTLPSPPFIPIQGIPNFRDLGGYALPNSPKSIRRSYIYRCGEPSRITPTGISTLLKLGITHFYDLRSLTEINRNIAAGRGGIVEWEGCKRVFVPVFKDADYSPEGIAGRYKDYASGSAEVRSPPLRNDLILRPNDAEPTSKREKGDETWLRNFASQGFTRAYTDILNNAPSAYKQILTHIASEPEKPFVIHCTAGKDRTGVLCALILSLCGVEDEVVAYEYSLTELGLAEYREKIIEHLMANPALKDNPEGAINMISAKAVNMMATLEMIRDKFGGAEGYMIEKCGLAKEQVEAIRKNLIVDDGPGYKIPFTMT